MWHHRKQLGKGINAPTFNKDHSCCGSEGNGKADCTIEPYWDCDEKIDVCINNVKL